MKITTLVNFLFGCHHSNLSRVFTIRRRTYRVCCDCGAEFDYSIKEMAIRRRQTHAPSQRGLERTDRATA
ncbi:MAG: hypothetical protein WAM71_12165 [Candidatus Korobacteraceae bacterium]